MIAANEKPLDHPPTPCDCGGKGCPVCAPTEDGPGDDDQEAEQ